MIEVLNNPGVFQVIEVVRQTIQAVVDDKRMQIPNDLVEFWAHADNHGGAIAAFRESFPFGG